MRSASDRACEATALTGWTDSETAHAAAVKAITAARLDVVEALRLIADGIYVDEADESQWFRWQTLRLAATELEQAIRAADADQENENG